MITVAGFNTAIDRRIDLDVLQPGAVQRAVAAQARPGGKGLHVAQTVAALGERVRLVGLTDAVHGPMIADHLRVRGVQWHGVKAPNVLRQCLALHEAGGRVTEVLEPGEELHATLREALLAAVRAGLDDSCVLVLSGSLPPGFPADTYAGLAREAASHGVRCLVDASGETLQCAVGAAPWLVKPNADEAAALTGHPLRDIDDAVACVESLHACGVAHPVVTLGARGAVGFDGEHLWHAALDIGDVRNAVGSGDCFLAGLAVAAARGEALDVALRRAVACGAANAEGEETGFATAARVEALMPHVRIEPARRAGRGFRQTS